MNQSNEGNSLQEDEDLDAAATDTDDIDEADATTAAEEAEEADETDETEQVAPEAIDPLEELRAEAARWQDLALRGQADLDNYRKRMVREKEDAIKYANAALLESLLPVLDNFNLGLDAASSEESSTIYQGMAMVRKQINEFLADCGVEEIATEGAVFDPNLHEALGQEFSDAIPEGTIIREHRKGYKLKDRLLRASKIVVSKGAPVEEPEDEGE